jgi:hypothetical protein
MRKLFVLMATAFLALGTAGVASAAVLNWAGTATVLLPKYGPAEFRGGGVATINGSSGVIPAHLNTLRLAASRGQIEGTVTRIVTDPDLWGSGAGPPRLIYDGVRLMTGTWGGISGGAASTSTGGGILLVGGLVKFCVLSTACTMYIPLVLNQPTTVNGVPGSGTKGVGVGGLITVGYPSGFGGVKISLQAAPWTIKTATVLDQIEDYAGGPRYITTLVAKGWAHAPASTTTSTAQPSGMVQLVTPNQVTTNLPLGSMYKMGSFAILVIRFIPEPGLLLLLGSGVAGLVILGRRRARG